MAEKTYLPNDLVFQKGDPSDFAYIIRSGEIEILRDFPDNPFRLAVLKAGDVFGEMGLIDERPRSLAARAIGETRLETVTRDEFVDLLQSNPNDALKYLRMFFERLRAMNHRVADAAPAPQNFSDRKDFEVAIFPLSPISERYIPSQGYRVKGKSFRIGRNSNRHEDPLEVNDLVLNDSPPYNISRNHFAIERDGDAVYVHDRGSFLGTVVNGQVIGGNHHAASIELKEGENEIIAGSLHSPFRFRIIVKPV